MPKKSLFIVLCLFVILNVQAQESVVQLFKSDIKIGDEYFSEGNYQSALDMYLEAPKKKRHSQDVMFKVARCYYFLKKYEKTTLIYDQYALADFSDEDLYYYAEALTSTQQYDNAIKIYEKCLGNDPKNELLIKKIWRLNNIKFLYEDSVYYALREVPINSKSGELCAVPYKKGIVFVSNRKETNGWVEKVDAASNAPFYKLFYSLTSAPTTPGEGLQYGRPVILDKTFNSNFHVGPVAFYDNYNKMVLATTGDQPSQGKERTLQLIFAEKENNTWEIKKPFPFNSNSFSNTDPTISADGKQLYFSSDRNGGFGDYDLYRSEYINGSWTEPVNLGEPINTTGEEVFPYLHINGSLYFSSNGHAGLGGLDIFKFDLQNEKMTEVENIGYPLNSNFDDFGIVIDSLSTHGYFTSNRKNGGLNDDIYEFDMDLQAYPLTVNGVVKYIEHNWSDSSQLKILPDVKLSLVDVVRQITVTETISNDEGNFEITIPYFSKYKVRVTGSEIGEGIISFEVPKHKKLNEKYEIVIVNDDFKPDIN